MHTLIRNSWKSPFTAATLIALVTSACVDIEDLQNPPPPPGDSSESGADPSDTTPDTTSDGESGGDTTGDESGGDTTSGESGDESGDPPTVCGNAVLEPAEQCDDGVNDGSYGACNPDCSFAPYCGDGSLAENEGCDDGNQIEDDGCTVKCTLATCGDGIVQEGEQCDGLGPDAACPMPEFDGGLLQCTAACTLDTSACVGCGNGVLDGTEICDGADVGGASCEGLGFDGGQIACNTNCGGLDIDDCGTCGDGTLDPGEVCDLSATSAMSCTTFGFTGGTMTCTMTCDGHDLSGCYACGDGLLDPTEACDGELLGDASCESLGYTGGTLGCDKACGLSTELCHNSACGDGTLQSGETCEGALLSGETCTSLGFAGGELACATNCLDFDTSPCTAATECGNGLLEAGEVCDAGELDGASCASLGFEWGALSCQADCQGFELAGCMVF